MNEDRQRLRRASGEDSCHLCSHYEVYFKIVVERKSVLRAARYGARRAYGDEVDGHNDER
jgi:hypothetical protein